MLAEVAAGSGAVKLKAAVQMRAVKRVAAVAAVAAEEVMAKLERECRNLHHTGAALHRVAHAHS